MTHKTIAFIEPGPNLVQFLAAVGRRLGPDHRAAFFSTRVKSRSLLRRLGQDPQPRRRSRPDADAGPPLDMASLLTRLRKTGDRALVEARSPEVIQLARDLDDFLDRHEPAGIFLWNGSGLSAAIADQLASRRGIPRIFAENGYLPNTLQVDPQGVNAFASIGRGMDLDEIRSLSYGPEQIREFERMLADYRAGRAPRRTLPPEGRVRPSPLAYLIQAWHDWRERDHHIDGNRLIPREIPTLPERFVFFPLQVRSDSQLTMHSPIYGNRLDQAIADLREAIGAVAPNLKLVVKLHPADLGKTDYDPIVREFPDVIWIGGGDVRGILRAAECVVTVNSTVGIEGLLFDKPVVTLGDNFYVREGLVHPVTERQQLAARLSEALTRPPDRELIAQYLRYLYFHAFVRAHWRDHSPASLDNLARRIRLMAGD
ncbi:capsular polysaccharide export protein, LipB/KpsS family [Imhoffiella purpurea]|uniref:Capsular polysaccharide export system protein KpsS n=1 Tax=Imhoffiella purpurea TaxID=1249627 RepID=W9VBU2_9GAMM|nr:capsular biosynthesis protein [Imhoffiella purpurea]EXJ17058.1 hypothetical protein D779_0810 [Imhoffiella purpurea]